MPDQDARGAEEIPGAPWWAAAALSDAALYPEVSLNRAEQSRAGGYHEGKPRENFSAGRILVKALAAQLLNRGSAEPAHIRAAELEINQYCPTCGSTLHGTPRLLLPGQRRSIAVSYARTGGWLVVAVGNEESLLGIDVADFSDASFAPGAGELLEDYAFSPYERAHLQTLSQSQRIHQRANWWSRKEAVAKASGAGLTGESGIPIVAGDGRHSLLRGPGTRIITLDSHNPDSLGHLLPDTLLGTMLWAPRTTG